MGSTTKYTPRTPAGGDVLGWPFLGDTDQDAPQHPPVRSELTVIARGSLLILGRQRDLFRFLARDAIDFPRLVARVHDELVAVGYRQLAASFRAQLNTTATHPAEADALAAVALSSLAHYRQDEATYGAPQAKSGRDRSWETKGAAAS